MASSASLIPLSAFVAALASGDVAIMDQYFLQHIARAQLDRTELHVAQSAWPEEARLPPWYVIEGTHATRCDRSRRIPELGYVDFLQWLFAPAQVATMRATLEMLLPKLCQHAVQTDSLEIMELLVTAALPVLVPDAPAQQLMLNQLITANSSSMSGAMARLLVAHGAELSLIMQWGMASPETVELLVTEGVCLVGATCLAAATVDGSVDVLARLLQCGVDVEGVVDADEHNTSVQVAACCCDAAKLSLFLRHGADADSRSIGSRATPLIQAIVEESSSHHGELAQFFQVLLAYALDIDAADQHGWTALHHAAYFLPEFVNSLLECGADPNVRSTDGRGVADMLVADLPMAFHPEPLAALLQHGADPYALGDCGRTMVDRLLDHDDGRAFVAAHPEYFAITKKQKIIE